MPVSDGAALDALAAALAPRLLREVRKLIEAEADDDHGLGLAVMARLGYSPGACAAPNVHDSARKSSKRKR